MKNRYLFASVAGLLIAVEAMAASSVSISRVAQRYPWNGLVDIDYTVEGLEGDVADHNVRLSVTDTKGTTVLTNFVECSNADMPVANGAHHVTWNAAADGYTQLTRGVTLTAAVERRPVTLAGADYLIVDISAGSTASTYPVRYVATADPATFNRDVYKTTKLVLKRVTAGTFQMGDTLDNSGKPFHDVTLTKDYFLGLFKVTCTQYLKVQGSGATASQKPMCGVKWDAWRSGFFANLTSRLRYKGASVESTVDFPTEAQWEYACRAGTTTAWFWGDKAEDGDAYCWNSSNYGGATVPNVGTKLPNPWGFYDIGGLAAELCFDWYAAYKSGAVTNPCQTEQSGTDGKVFRGTSHHYDNTPARSGYRRYRTNGSFGYGSYSGDYVGVRTSVALSGTGRIEPAAAETVATATSSAFVVDARTDEVRVVTDVADILPILYNNDANWADGGSGATLASVDVTSYTGDPAAAPSTWTKTAERKELVSAAGAGSVTWSPTIRKLYRLALTVGTAETGAAWFDLTGATALAEPTDVKSAAFTLSAESFTCDGDAKVPDVTVKVGDSALVRDVDYTLEISNNINPGKGKIRIIGIGAYTGIAETTFTITEPVPRDVSSDTLSGCAAIDTRTDAIRALEDIGELLPLAYNSTAAWTRGGDAATATITAYTMIASDRADASTWVANGETEEVLEEAAGEGTVEWGVESQKLVKLVLSAGGKETAVAYFDLLDTKGLSALVDIQKLKFTLSAESFVADGESHEPTVTVKDENDNVLTRGVDYEYVVSDTINAGTSVITLSGIGDYQGATQLVYQITAKTPEVAASVASTAPIAIETSEAEPLVLRNSTKLLPVNWNSTNTWAMGGSAVATDRARVSVAELASADDPSDAATWKVLRTMGAEGAFHWTARKGIWRLKIEFVDENGECDDEQTLYRTIVLERDSGFTIILR